MGGCCCCCSPPKETELSDPPPSFNQPRELEEGRLPYSDPGFASASSEGPQVDSNLETSNPDTNRPPPAPVPSSSDTMAVTQTPPGAREISDNKTAASLQSTNPHLVHDPSSASASSGGPQVDSNLETSNPDTNRPPPAPVPSSSDTVAVTQTPAGAREISDNKTNASLQSTNPHLVHDIASTSDGHGNLKDTELDSAEDSENELQNVEEPVNLAEEKDGCPICLEGYDAVDPQLKIKCGHHFHLACILDWRERKSTCPVCEMDMVFDPPID